MDTITWQWILVIGSSVLLFLIAPWAKTSNDFFRGSKNEQAPGFWMLTSSLVISWLFAKSITNAANLGLAFGLVGGVAYATYYLSFLVAGLIIYRMRTQGGFASIHQFLQTRYGRASIVIFSLLIGFRLLNEVWSNTMVIGTYFGAQGSGAYYLAILTFTLLTMAYTLKGGLRSSLLTDLIQMLLFGILLVVILGVLIPRTEGGVQSYLQSGSWTMAGGLNLMLVALVQVFSYPFHDPVLTDRAFIAPPKRTLQSFLLATLVGGVSILLFSFVGIYAQQENLSGQAPVAVSQLLGVGMSLLMNFIMITSAASTLDSTFNSFSKLMIIDLGGGRTASIAQGRLLIVLMAALGTIPIFLGAEILSATTVSGTMVIGLTPVFVFWRRSFPAVS
ncbi:MAG: sodium:solute symporter, partial [Bacteroidota bacterium]